MDNHNISGCESDLWYMRFAVEKILASRLLLDEEKEEVESRFLCSYPEQLSKQSVWAPICVSVASSATCALLSVHGFFHPLLAATGALSAGYMLLPICSAYKRKNMEENLMSTLNYSHSILKLNGSVLDYLKQRKAASDNRGYFSLFNEEIQSLMYRNFTNIYKLLAFFKDIVTFCVKELPILEEAHLVFSNIEYYENLEIENIFDCVKYQEKFNDIFLLTCSNTLSCFALFCCPSIWNRSNVNVGELLYNLLPITKTGVEAYYKMMKQDFTEVKSKLIKVIPFVSEMLTPHISKYHTSLRYSIMQCNRMAITLEQSNAVFMKLQEVRFCNVDETAIVGLALNAIREDTKNFFNSLEVLCNVFELSQVCGKVTQTDYTEAEKQTQTEPKKLQRVSFTIGYDPWSVEEYEATVEKDGSQPSVSTYQLDQDDESETFIASMAKEMKLCLLNEHRFAAAREKHSLENLNKISDGEIDRIFIEEKREAYKIPSYPIFSGDKIEKGDDRLEVFEQVIAKHVSKIQNPDEEEILAEQKLAEDEARAAEEATKNEVLVIYQGPERPKSSFMMMPDDVVEIENPAHIPTPPPLPSSLVEEEEVEYHTFTPSTESLFSQIRRPFMAHGPLEEETFENMEDLDFTS